MIYVITGNLQVYGNYDGIDHNNNLEAIDPTNYRFQGTNLNNLKPSTLPSTINTCLLTPQTGVLSSLSFGFENGANLAIDSIKLDAWFCGKT